jgi:alpha-glucosidase
MRWNADRSAGFTAAGVDPWLPFGDAPTGSVADQRDNPESALHLTRDLIALRRELPALRAGRYETWPAPADVWAWRRGDEALVAVNFAETATALDGVDGTVRISTDRARDGELVGGSLVLGPLEAVIVDLT